MGACQNASKQRTSLAAGDSITPAQRSIVVPTGADPVAAVARASAGTTVLFQPGEYEVSRTLVIPEGVTLLGSARMKRDAQGLLPIGFDSSTRTVLRSVAGMQGDVLILGNHSAVRGLTIEDVAGRAGNVVVALTRGGEKVSATLEDCEVINPNRPVGAKEGPIGRAVVAVTAAPSAKDSVRVGSSIELRMSRCIVRSPLGSGVFATNFAPRAHIGLVLTDNIIVGGMTASAAASRAIPVSGANTSVESRGNLFRADSATPPDIAGWLISAVATPHGGVPPAATSKDTLYLRSTGDRIEGFRTGIVGTGAFRIIPQAGPLSENLATLELRQTEIRSLEVDLDLSGALSRSAGTLSDAGNVLRVDAAGVIGSGARKNSFVMTSGPPATTWQSGNRLELIGSALTFTKLNSRIIPSPHQEAFRVAR
jgi:hypothetical protein